MLSGAPFLVGCDSAAYRTDSSSRISVAEYASVFQPTCWGGSARSILIGLGRRQAEGSRSDVVVSGVVDSGRALGHGNIDPSDPFHPWRHPRKHIALVWPRSSRSSAWPQNGAIKRLRPTLPPHPARPRELRLAPSSPPWYRWRGDRARELTA